MFRNERTKIKNNIALFIAYISRFEQKNLPDIFCYFEKKHSLYADQY